MKVQSISAVSYNERDDQDPCITVWDPTIDQKFLFYFLEQLDTWIMIGENQHGFMWIVNHVNLLERLP